MGVSFLKVIIKYIHLIPTFIFTNFIGIKNKFSKSKLIFDTIQYKSDYSSDNFFIIFLPLLMSILQISKDIQTIVNNKKLVSITSTIVFYEKENNNEYTHSLSESNQLYNLNSFNNWSTILLLSILEKLETYNSFKKISVIIQVKTITNI